MMLCLVVARFLFIYLFILLAIFLMVFPLQVREMSPQLPVAPENYPSFVGYELLPFLGARGVADLRRSIL